MKLSPNDWLAFDREISGRSLSDFLKLAWPVLEPGQPYVHGWHMDAMAEHLEAVAKGSITRLLINIPPGTSKSTLCGVMFPAWLWGPHGRPSARIIGASHEQGLATRDNRKTRLLIESDWYQARWPVRLTSDQNEKTFFENERSGFRQATAVASMTGRRGDFVLWDDPHSPEKAYSEAHRETAIRVFSETLPTRLNNPDRSAIVVVMQRLHEDDISGHILATESGYEHLCLPMEFEPERRCVTSLGWQDPRKDTDELLFPERFSREVVERDKTVMGSFATAGQFQQRPAPRGGGMFKRDWFTVVGAAPVDCRWVRGWDLAATADVSAAWTAGVLIGRARDGRFYIADARRIQGTAADVERLLINTASQDGKQVRGSLPQDPGQAGKSQVQYLIRQLAGFDYHASPESGDKETRARPLAAQAEAGNVLIVKGDWNRDFLAEMETFPMGKFMDQVDAASRAFGELVKRQPTAKTATVKGLY